MPTKNTAGFSINKALEDPNILNMMATLGIALDPEGVGGALGRQAQRSVSSRQASKANSKVLSDIDALTPQGQPGPTKVSVQRNKEGNTTTTVQSDLPRAQQVPDDRVLGINNTNRRVRTLTSDVSRRVIARAKQRGVNPVTALNLVTYDLENVNEPHLSRYDPDSAVDYFAELLQSEGSENAALVAYRNRPGSEGDPNYLGNVTSYTPYSMRAIDADAGTQVDVSNMIASRESPSVSSTTKPLQKEVDTALAPYRISERNREGADPTVFNDAIPQRRLTEQDLAGLTPAEQRQIAQTYIENRGLDVDISRIGVDIAKELGISQRSTSKAKIDAARAIANSGLSPSNRAALLEYLRAASTPAEIEQIEVAVANAPAPASAGTDRDAVSSELYSKRYYDLTKDQQIEVNRELNDRLAPTAEVVQTEDGVYVVNKRTNRARAVTVAPATQGETPSRTTPSSEAPSAPSQTSQTGGVTKPTSKTSIDTFINSVSGDPGVPAPGEQLRGKALNEAQARAYGYGSRALQAETISEELEDDPSNRARIAGIRSYINNKIEELGNNGTVGYAGGAIAVSGPLIKSTIEDISERDIRSLVRRFGQSTANRLLTLSSLSKTASKAALGALVANILSSTVAEPLAQSLRTNEEQQYIQAKLDFTAALLRKESGAAILASEYKDTDKRYYPQVGDGEPVIAQKRAARQQVIRLLQREAGRPLLPPARGLVAPVPAPTQTQTTPGKSQPFIVEEVIKRLIEDMQIPFRRQGQQPPDDPGATLNKLFEPHKGQDIVAGKADYLVKELMNMSTEELNSIMDTVGIPRAKQSAIRVRIKRLRDAQEGK